MVVQVPLILGFREMTAGKVTGPAGSSGVLGSQAFRLDFKCALGNSLNLCDICFVPHMFKSVSPESTAELLCVCVCVCECAHTHSQSCPTVCDLMDYSHGDYSQPPLFMRFSRQEYWSGLSCPSSGNLPSPGIEPISPALAVGFFTTCHLGSPTPEPRSA